MDLYGVRKTKTTMKPEDKSLTKGRMILRKKYKKLAATFNELSKEHLIKIIKSGSVCELKESENLSNGAETITVKIYFKQQ
jgi:hypothetical protein